MKIGIISDTHDNLKNLRKFIELSNNKINPDLIIFCGDLCSPFVIKELGKLNCNVHIIFGNNEGDKQTIIEFAKKYKNIKIYKQLGEIEIDNKKIAFIHYPDLARGLASTGNYDIVFCGHTHQLKIEKINNIPLVNPGELFGELTGKSTFALYDTKAGEVEIKNLE